MARVGIGVPVYNGGELLRASLECLRTQTFEDFEVVISDNASSDQTAEICTGFAARDPRFRYLRQAENIGMVANFVAVRDAATAPLFLWRAYDDLSDANYLEALAGCFERDPGTRLAVGTVRTEIDHGVKVRVHRPVAAGWPRIAGIARQMFGSHASWVYGMWHRETLIEVHDRVLASYPHAWGFDHLVLLPMILDGVVRGTRATTFLQRIFRADRKLNPADRPGMAEMRALRRCFAEACAAEIGRRRWAASERAALRLMMPFYVSKRAYRRSKLLRGQIREWRARAQG